MFSIWFVILSVFWSSAQELDDGKINTLLTRSYTVGLNLNTSGWGVAFDYTKQKNYKYKILYGLTFTNIRHDKEFKILGTAGSKGYYFGKINSLVSLRPTYGGKRVMYKSVRENGVEISYKWQLGLSLGLVKPVYIELNQVESGNLFHYPVRYNPEDHYASQIFSRSPWVKGLGEAKLATGLFFKNGLDFNFSTIKTGISGGEIGFMVDYYPLNEIDLMYLQNTNNLFASLYLQFNIGKKF